MNSKVLQRPFKAKFQNGFFRPSEEVKVEDGTEVVFYILSSGHKSDQTIDEDEFLRKIDRKNSNIDFAKMVAESPEDDNVNWNEYF